MDTKARTPFTISRLNQRATNGNNTVAVSCSDIAFMYVCMYVCPNILSEIQKVMEKEIAYRKGKSLRISPNMNTCVHTDGRVCL